MNKKLIFIVGETGAGKDTVSNRLHYNKVISYKTGPLRDTDIQGVTHNFISDEEMDILETRDDLIAYTRIGDIRYCATPDQLYDDVMIYIINPDGVEWFEQNYKKEDIDTFSICLYAPLEVRRDRCKDRSDYNTMFDKRVAAEEEDHSRFRSSNKYDLFVENDNLDETIWVIEDHLQKWFSSKWKQ